MIVSHKNYHIEALNCKFRWKRRQQLVVLLIFPVVSVDTVQLVLRQILTPVVIVTDKG